MKIKARKVENGFIVSYGKKEFSVKMKMREGIKSASYLWQKSRR